MFLILLNNFFICVRNIKFFESIIVVSSFYIKNGYELSLMVKKRLVVNKDLFGKMWNKVVKNKYWLEVFFSIGIFKYCYILDFEV